MNVDDPIYKKYKSYEKDIFKFDRINEESNFVPSTYCGNPKEEGMYVTIRCGLSGIYQVLNWWKDGKWQMECCDGSSTIAYSRNKVEL